MAQYPSFQPSGEEPRIRTTHTGSLPRPDAMPANADRVVAVVERQVTTGLDVVNDGEANRESYVTYVTERLTGFAGAGRAFGGHLADVEDFPSFAERFASDHTTFPRCVGPIAHAGGDAVRRDVANLTAALDGVGTVEPFLTAASPGVVAMAFENTYYDHEEDYVLALADALRPEYAAVVDAGVALQVDCPDLAACRHMNFAAHPIGAFLERCELHVEALRRALAGLPADRLRLHLCWGNYEGPHHHDVPLRDVLPIVLQAPPATLVLEAANPRHAHEWRVFEEIALPDDKSLVAGVIDTSTNYIEHPELVAERICRFAELVGPERLLAGTDCGLGTYAAAERRVNADVAWAKLDALVAGARLASARLWHTAARPASIPA